VHHIVGRENISGQYIQIFPRFNVYQWGLRNIYQSKLIFFNIFSKKENENRNKNSEISEILCLWELKP
jgi:hypothetical protein